MSDNSSSVRLRGSGTKTTRKVPRGVKIAKRMRWHFPALSAMTVGSVMLTVSIVLAQAPAAQPIAAQDIQTVSVNALGSLPRQPAVPAILSRQPSTDAGALAPAQPNEHPLMPVLRWAKQGLPAIENLQDYSATLVKRERIRGKLSGYEYLSIKIRHKPLSVYARFLAPVGVEGQEVIYIAGQNQGNMWAHKARSSLTVSLRPEGLLAMNGRRYPLTEIGLVNLVRRLVEVGEQDVHYGECEVKYFMGAKVDKRPCTVIQVVHPVQRDTFSFHLARVFVDDELKVPIRYESHYWPREPGGEPLLLEEYTYLDLKMNNGFTDADFSPENPEYHFHQSAARLRQGKEAP
jgi:hypothetical protein